MREKTKGNRHDLLGGSLFLMNESRMDGGWSHETKAFLELFIKIFCSDIVGLARSATRVGPQSKDVRH